MPMILSVAALLAAALLAAVSTPVNADAYRAPTIDPAEDAGYLEYIDGERVLFWPADAKVVGFRNMQALVPVRRIEAAPRPLLLPENPKDLGAIPIELPEGATTLDGYFDEYDTAGMLVIHDGEIVYERYGLGNTADSRWVSFSVAKSVVAMLIGAAIQDGYIRSVDEKVSAYLPRLADTPYADTTIRNLLQMASGVAWNEDYADPTSDVNTANWATTELYGFLNGKSRVAPPGERFNYNTAETNLAGTLLRAAIGNNLSTYLTEKVWRPFGMETDAYWQLTEPGGGEFGGCCINATLRGLWTDRAVCPGGWSARGRHRGAAGGLDGGIHGAVEGIPGLWILLVAESRRHLRGVGCLRSGDPRGEGKEPGDRRAQCLGACRPAGGFRASGRRVPGDR